MIYTHTRIVYLQYLGMSIIFSLFFVIFLFFIIKINLFVQSNREDFSYSPHSSIVALHGTSQSSRGMNFSTTRAPGTRQLLLTFFLWVPVCDPAGE